MKNRGKPLSRKELEELKKYEKVQEQMSVRVKGRRRDTKGKFVKAPAGEASPLKAGGKYAKLAAELKQIAALDAQFDEHFELEKHPRVKAALQDAVAAKVEDIIKQRFEELGGRKDFRKVTLQQLIEITGKKRRTIYFWLDRGLPREDDNNFWLPKVFEWLEKYTETKTLNRLPEEKQQTDYQRERARQLRLHIAEQEHRLLDRTEVMAGIIARHQQLVSSLQNKAEEQAILLHGQPKAKIAEELRDFYEKILTAQCKVPEELKLPPALAEQFTKLLELVSG